MSEAQKDQEEEIELPESYDWRDAYPQCVQPVQSIGGQDNGNCSSSYVFATLQAVADRICMGSNATIRLSAQEIIDCDASNYGCDGGYANKVLNFGMRKGYVTEECYEYAGKAGECEADHFESNACRVDNQVYRVNDVCLSYQDENIKRELVKNGPVVVQTAVHTDFLPYKSGSYHRT